MIPLLRRGAALPGIRLKRRRTEELRGICLAASVKMIQDIKKRETLEIKVREIRLAHSVGG